MNQAFAQHLRAMIKIGQELVRTSDYLGAETGDTNANGDQSIEMDVALEKAFITYIKDHNLPVKIFSEECGTVDFHPAPEYLISFDPLDGSANYKYGKGLLPFGSLFAVYKGTQPKLGDVIAAAAVEYTRNVAWFYDEGVTRDLEGNKVVLKSDWGAKKLTPVYLDIFYQAAVEIYRPFWQKLFVRNAGSMVGNLSLTLSNVSALTGGVCVKAEEIGAVYALMKGAGATVTDNEGVSIDEMLFDPEVVYPILAGSSDILDFAMQAMALKP